MASKRVLPSACKAPILSLSLPSASSTSCSVARSAMSSAVSSVFRSSLVASPAMSVLVTRSTIWFFILAISVAVVPNLFAIPSTTPFKASTWSTVANLPNSAYSPEGPPSCPAGTPTAAAIASSRSTPLASSWFISFTMLSSKVPTSRLKSPTRT